MTASVPPMGWNSWDCYGASVTEAEVLRNAEYMAKHLKRFGWEYIVVDIEWYQPTADTHDYKPFAPLTMDEYGRLQPAVNRFPSAENGQGFKPLAEMVHRLGLKFGIHIMRGLPRMAAHLGCPIAGSPYTCREAANAADVCAWNPDMYGLHADHPAARAYYDSVFRMYAEWGVDFVKCDDIAREYPRCRREIEIISEACRKSGHDIVLSLSPGPAPLEQAEHLKENANMWRITDDFWDEWPLLLAMFERAEKWCIHSGPGHWPDADMLPVGALRQCYTSHPRGDWTNFTKAEQRTMMTLWCMMRSPLMIGGELTKNDPFTLSLLTNAEVLEIEKKSYCAHPVMRSAERCIWVAPSRETGIYIAAFNLSEKEQKMDVEGIELPSEYVAKELWTKRQTENRINCMLGAHDVALWHVCGTFSCRSSSASSAWTD